MAIIIAVNCGVYFIPATNASESVSVQNQSATTVVSEDTSLRGRYEKHFLMSDGTYQAVSYIEPVHKLVDGEWEEIDNSLSLQLDEKEGLVALLKSDRTVEFLNKEQEVVFTMWAPYMYDSASALSEQISVRLVDKGNGQYLLTLVPDADWLNSAERVYPVVIDPVVEPNRAKANIIDNYVLEGEGTQNKNLDRLYIGNKSGKTARAFIKYSAMPYIPKDAEIYSGYMRLALTSGTSTMHRASLSMVTGGDWSSGTINWSNMPAANTLVHPYADPFLSDLDGYYVYYFTLTTAVLTWYNNSPTGSNANYGVMVQYYDETIADYNAFYSADCATESIRPYLFIIYGMPEEEPVDIVWPVPDHYVVKSEWGYRNYDSEIHHGIDISCYEVQVLAAVDGEIVGFRDWTESGQVIILRAEGTDVYLYYKHLKEDSFLVEVGDFVEAGTPIAISGNTGSAGTYHLHFELQYENNAEMSYNPLEIYHPDDIRSAWTNPNPMFLYAKGEYIPNPDFSFEYVASDYNDTDDERWKK